MGTSTACGHYVAHVKNDQAVGKDETDWLIFNDNKESFHELKNQGTISSLKLNKGGLLQNTAPWPCIFVLLQASLNICQMYEHDHMYEVISFFFTKKKN